ncbi:arylsulfatase [Paraflavisolibacter sp. H34]|uniref:arylsulfatase n=1 Tax=Huijunlia imazamoxiresistens TaxID=3127457 RepID=UPI00301875B2
MKKPFWQLLAVAAPLLAAAPVQAQQKSAARPPNIIFIIADDLGYGNLTSFNPGSKIPTPNIDRLAKEGTRFTRFYAGNTVCAPSRCALMTGRHMGHAYVRGNNNVPLRPQDTTLAQRLQAAGYVTGMFGKWGLGEESQTGAPHLKGFDAFYGYLNQTHAHDYFTDHLFELKGGKLARVEVDTTRYAHDLIAGHALDFLQENRNKPFFLYLPFTIPHAELRLPDSLIRPFLNADGSSKFAPDRPFPGRNTYSAQAHPHAAFAAMITKLDSDVGRLLQQVKALGLDDNTYIFFTSDNGPHKEGGADPDYFQSAGPLRGIKRDLYEGGIRVPLLVRAPKKVPANRTSDVPWAFWDVVPTLAQLSGAPVPGGGDGLSFAPAVLGQAQPRRHDYLYWQFREGLLKEAVLQGDWKLIRFKSKGSAERLELYHLKEDVGEQNNLAARYPDRVRALQALLKGAKTPSEHPAFDWSEEEL